MPTFDCIERPLAIFFYRYGCFVSKYPWPFISLPLLFTLAMSTGFLYMESITDAIYLFTPINAQSKMERQAIHDLWPLVNGSYIPGRAVTQSREVQLTVHAKNNANILNKPYSEAVYRLDMYIQKSVKVYFNNRTYYYSDLCLGRHNQGCPGNKHISIISDLFQHGLNITYPTIHFGNVRAYIGSSLGGVSVAQLPNNKTLVLRGAKAWFLIYHLQFYPQNISYISGLWEKAFQKAVENYRIDPYIDFTYFHSQTLAEELKRNADSLIPRFIFAFFILMLFSIICNMSFCDNSFYIDWVISKPFLAVMGVLNAGMGILSGVGSLLLFEVGYNDIVGVMPFLVVAVGIDNMFLMVAAVRRTNRAFTVDQRIGEAMSDAAISMFITSLTDALSFGVGAITTIPAVQIFCFFTCAAITFTFIFQLTFFHGLLALSIRWEAKGRHSLFFCSTINETDSIKCSLIERLFLLGTRADPDPQNLKVNLKESSAALFYQNWYGPILMQPVVRFLACIWFIIYLIIAIYGCMQLREGLEPVNLLVEDSYAIPHYKALEHYFWHYGASLQIVINNAPDMRDALTRNRLKTMANEFANTKHGIGPNSIQFWLIEMDRYYKSLNDPTVLISNSTRNFYDLARNFFLAKNTEYWPDDVKWDRLADGTYGIKSFRFLIGLRDISTSVQQQDAVQTMRSVAAEYSDLNVTTFMPLWLFTDQYALVVPNTIQNIIIAMIVMVIISVLLIPQPSCALWVTLAIASIDIGVVGFMTLWNVNLDAISMITIIMSIGFSVDYSAHITYGYVVSDKQLPSDRIRDALGALGWPLTQGAVSTILAVIVLADVPAYMIVTFFKTVFLSISLGLLHGLVFLPVALSLFVRGSCIAASTPKKSFHNINDVLEMKQCKKKQQKKIIKGVTNQGYT